MAELLDVESSRCVVVLFCFHDSRLVPLNRPSASLSRSSSLCSAFERRSRSRKSAERRLRSVLFLRSVRFVRFSTSVGVAEEKLNYSPQTKLLKVAIIGRPNAGKSTLINKILNLNVCGVSLKTHTTRTPFRAAFTQGDTQVVFVDTPGLVTQKEYSRFQLTNEFLAWKKNILQTVDIVGVIHEASRSRDIFKLHLNVIQNLNELPESLPLFLVLNKIDLVLDKEALLAVIDSCSDQRNLEEENSNLDKATERSKTMRRFSKIFFTSAIHNKGVDEVSNFLLEQAKPGIWPFEPGQIFEKPLDTIIKDLLRAKLMDILPHEIPYQCRYEIEYLKENDLGEILCVSLVTCRCARHLHLITSGKKGSLRTISKQLEFDLYKILGKVFKIRVVVQTKKK